MIKSKVFSDRIKCIISWLILYRPIQWCLRQILDEEIKPLHETKVFILGISVPITATILSFGLLIWTTGRYRNFNFSSSGFAEFFEIYRFPLWVLVGTAALTALSVALHRSKETAKQIETSLNQLKTSQDQAAETANKNIAENYIKHHDFFISQLTSLESDNNLFVARITLKNILYSRIFRSNSFSEFNHYSDADTVNELISLYNRLVLFLIKNTSRQGQDNYINLNFTAEIFHEYNKAKTDEDEDEDEDENSITITTHSNISDELKSFLNSYYILSNILNISFEKRITIQIKNLKIIFGAHDFNDNIVNSIYTSALETTLIAHSIIYLISNNTSGSSIYIDYEKFTENHKLLTTSNPSTVLNNIRSLFGDNI